MIQIHYFASFREQLGIDKEDFEIQPNITVATLIEQLKSRGQTWQTIFEAKIPVLCAKNQAMVDFNEIIQDGDEVAFFPPVTGG